MIRRHPQLHPQQSIDDSCSSSPSPPHVALVASCHSTNAMLHVDMARFSSSPSLRSSPLLCTACLSAHSSCPARTSVHTSTLRTRSCPPKLSTRQSRPLRVPFSLGTTYMYLFSMIWCLASEYWSRDTYRRAYVCFGLLLVFNFPI